MPRGGRLKKRFAASPCKGQISNLVDCPKRVASGDLVHKAIALDRKFLLGLLSNRARIQTALNEQLLEAAIGRADSEVGFLYPVLWPNRSTLVPLPE